jgi:hypothetical protein
MSGILLFGLQLQCVHNQRISKQKIKGNRIIPFENAGNTTHRSRLNEFGKTLLSNFNESSDDILNTNSSELIGITLKINGQLYHLCFKEDDNEKKLYAEAVVQQLDQHNISQSGYRSLAKLDPNLPRENTTSNVKKEITNLMNNEIPVNPINIHSQNIDENDDSNNEEEHSNLDIELKNEITNAQGQGGYRSIKKILTFVIKMLINQGVLNYPLDDNIHIRISGDGRNVGKKIKHVMITFAIMNNKNAIFLPDHHYSLVLYSGIEKYEYLQKALLPLINELDDIDKNGFTDSIGQKWKITIYFSSDWKFLSICLGINNATANHFCPWCLCSKSDHSKLEKEWNISKKMEIIKFNYKTYPGHKCQPLFSMIPLTRWIPDELHLMLRITDRLWSLMLSETNYQSSDQIREQIKNEMLRIGVHFEFWQNSDSKSWNYTSLMGEDKLKVLKNYNLESVLSENRSTIIRQLWNDFDDLYTALQDTTTDPIAFKNQAKLWLIKFLTPSVGDPRKKGYIKGLYTNNDVTPYIHVLVHHVYEFMIIHHNYGIKAFTCSPVEKKNHMQISKYFRKTLKDGGRGRKKAVIEILEHENRLLYYNYNQIPTISKNIKTINIK